MNWNKLTKDGKIKKNQDCPFEYKCHINYVGKCVRNKDDYNVDFSCACARGWDFAESRGIEEKDCA